jgi:ABC-2 type transport system permease protein
MNAVADSIDAPQPANTVRPFIWLLRRELWEHRSLWMTPVIVTVLTLIVALLGLMSGNLQGMPTSQFIVDSESSRVLVMFVAMSVAATFLVVMQIVWVYYSIDAMTGERRDRSILFWKSLPVSDLQTVLAKIATVTAVAPMIVFIAIVVTQLVALLILTVALAAHGQSAWMLWTQPSLVSGNLVVIYTLAVLSLWYLPVYAWLLLVSAWVRRSVMLWAILPPLAIMAIEKASFGTTYVASALGSRLATGMRLAFNPDALHFASRHDGAPANILSVINIPQLFASLEFWAGLAVAAGLIAATVWVRRYREPL